MDKALKGGFSYQPYTEEYPDTGYIYSVWPERGVEIPIGEVTSERLEEFVIENADILTQENRYFGGWVEDGILYLDISKRNFDREDAIREASEAQQQAIFHLDEVEEIFTPYYYDVYLPSQEGKG